MFYYAKASPDETRSEIEDPRKCTLLLIFDSDYCFLKLLNETIVMCAMTPVKNLLCFTSLIMIYMSKIQYHKNAHAKFSHIVTILIGAH